jgi:hypothetical protein
LICFICLHACSVLQCDIAAVMVVCLWAVTATCAFQYQYIQHAPGRRGAMSLCALCSPLTHPSAWATWAPGSSSSSSNTVLTKACAQYRSSQLLLEPLEDLAAAAVAAAYISAHSDPECSSWVESFGVRQLLATWQQLSKAASQWLILGMSYSWHFTVLSAAQLSFTHVVIHFSHR